MTIYQTYAILRQPGPTTAEGIQTIAKDCWGYFSGWNRTVAWALESQGRRNPVNPRTMRQEPDGRSRM